MRKSNKLIPGLVCLLLTATLFMTGCLHPWRLASNPFTPVPSTEPLQTDPATEAPVDTDEPVDTDTPVPGDTDTPAPGDTDTPAPGDTDTAAPVDTDTPAPGDTDTPAPGDTDTPDRKSVV